jgi:N-dimethylarginine dimethylaminohydrolase
MVPNFEVVLGQNAFIALMMEAVRTSEASAYSNEITRRYIPEVCHLHTRRRENLTSHFFHLIT